MSAISWLCARDISDAEDAWADAGPAEQRKWASRHAFIAIWLTEDVLDREES